MKTPLFEHPHRACHTCLWYYEWHSSPNLPDTKHCAMHQNPTGAPCALYRPKTIKAQA
ncbi:MAG: hypothetical protein IJN29_01580 [Akkermansia sp.]|nr:hypothetical protein [Akkermansia sp.]